MIDAVERIREFQLLCTAIEPMRGFNRPWFVCGGWAIDLFLKRVRRRHDDLEIAIFRDDQRELRLHLFSWSFAKVVQPEGRREEWGADEWLATSTHEIHARAPDGQPLEFLLNERAGDRWIYRRDSRITRAIDNVSFISSIGIPTLSPEVVLLYKSKSPRAKDDLDFAHVVPALGVAQRRWLAQAIATVDTHHPWLGRIS